MSNQTHSRSDDIENFRDDPDHDLQHIVETTSAPVVGSNSDAVERRRLGKLIAERRLLLRGLPIPYGPQQELHSTRRCAVPMNCARQDFPSPA
jgi:hypothetical protein